MNNCQLSVYKMIASEVYNEFNKTMWPVKKITL